MAARAARRSTGRAAGSTPFPSRAAPCAPQSIPRAIRSGVPSLVSLFDLSSQIIGEPVESARPAALMVVAAGDGREPFLPQGELGSASTQIREGHGDNGFGPAARGAPPLPPKGNPRPFPLAPSRADPPPSEP